MTGAVEISFFWIMLAIAFAVGILAGRTIAKPQRDEHEAATDAAKALAYLVAHCRQNGILLPGGYLRRAYDSLARLGLA